MVYNKLSYLKNEFLSKYIKNTQMLLEICAAVQIGYTIYAFLNPVQVNIIIKDTKIKASRLMDQDIEIDWDD
jgi:hypothetical protein